MENNNTFFSTIIFNPIFLIIAIILIFITLRLKRKGYAIPTAILVITIFFFPQAIEDSACSPAAIINNTCTIENGKTWLIIVALFIYAITTVIAHIIANIIRDKMEVNLDDKTSIEQENFIKNPNEYINKKPVIKNMPKKKCQNCGALNGINAQKCFICNKNLKK